MAEKPTNAGKPITDAYAREILQEQAKFEADRKALQEEFAEQIKEKGELFSDEDVKDKVKEVLPDAFAQLKVLINNAESETVRASLIKFVFESALVVLKKEAKDGKVPNTVDGLMAELKKNDDK